GAFLGGQHEALVLQLRAGVGALGVLGDRLLREDRGSTSGAAHDLVGQRVPGALGALHIGGRHQPTAPSICISIRRLSSRAYSMGSSRAMGSTKPRTIIAIASASSMPRLIR